MKTLTAPPQATPAHEQLFHALHRMIQNAALHMDNNRLLLECVDDFIRAVQENAVDGEPVTIQISRGRFYLNGEKLLYRRSAGYFIHKLLEDFGKIGFHGLRFHPSLAACPTPEILAVTRLLGDAPGQKKPLEWFAEQVLEYEFSWFELLQHAQTSSAEGARLNRERSMGSYSGALSSLRNAVGHGPSGRPSGSRVALGIVREMVDVIIEDDSVLLALSTLRDYDDYTFVHSVNVAIHAIRLGKHIGLSEDALVLLGLCGLFHDLGKCAIPPHILNKPGKLTDEEWEAVRRHPVDSACHILKLEISHELSSKILMAPLEHHLKYDHSGYPHSEGDSPISLFGRILAIVDVFDAITSPRAYRLEAMSPDRAIELMSKDMGKGFDPILLKVFINSLGVFPVGTLLTLNGNRLGLVMDRPERLDEWRPRVLLLVKDAAGAYVRGDIIDLADKDPATGAHCHTIEGSMHPATLGIQPATLLCADDKTE
jgi:hypothetical protein